MESIFILTYLFLIILGSSPKVINSQADSCASNLNLNGQSLPFDTSSLHCNPVWNPQDFILRYAQQGPNVWSFVLSAPNTNAYVAIGYSSDGKMVGSSAIVGWVSLDSSATMKKYRLGGTSPNLVVPDQGSLQIVNNSDAIITVSSRIYMAFQLSTNQPETRLIYAIGPDGRLPVGPGFQLSQHRNMISTSLNYVTGQSQKQTPYGSLRKSHGTLNLIGWGILMPIGAIVARFLKQYDPFWFYSHITIQSIGFILGVAGVICGLVLEDKLSARVNNHKGLGIFILTLGCLQVMAFLARPSKESKYRKYWNWYHYTVGRLVIVFAAVNVFYGIHLGNAGHGWNAGYAVVLVALFILAVVLELRMHMKK